MKAVVSIFVFFIIGFFEPNEDAASLTHRFIVQPTSQLVVSGKTNVNSFQCVSLYTGNDTLVLREGGIGAKPVFEKGMVALKAAAFDCGMKVMTSDFAKTIKATEYPTITIYFISFERTPVYTNLKDQFKGKLKISLGGITKPFDVDCTIEVKSDGLIHLKGGRNFVFKDFNLEAPTRMMGLVRVDENLEVNFHLVLTLDPNG